MNPAELFRMKAGSRGFAARHPKFTAFLRYAAEHSLKTGSVVDITIRQPDGAQTHANARLSEEDAQLLQTLLRALKTEEPRPCD